MNILDHSMHFTPYISKREEALSTVVISCHCHLAVDIKVRRGTFFLERFLSFFKYICKDFAMASYSFF